MSNVITIFDTTLRDGEQSPGFSMTPEGKLCMGHQLVRLGVDVIEAGFPAASEDEFMAVRMLAEGLREGPVVAALARACEHDINRAAEALRPAVRPRIHTFIAVSDIHITEKLRTNRDAVLQAARSAIRHALKYCDDVQFGLEDATRADRDFLCRLVEIAIAAGARTIDVADTVGYTMPWEFSELIRELFHRVPNIDKAVVAVHCHDDLGLAVANSLAALRAGALQVDCTINGIGERAGNASLEEIVMALKVRCSIFQLNTGVRTEEIYPTSKLLEEITGISVQPNKAIVGTNAFAHEAGIHQHGVLVNPLTYEIMTPQSVGVPGSQLVLGKHSGRHALRNQLEVLGIHVASEQQLDGLFARFKALADQRKVVSSEDLIHLSVAAGIDCQGSELVKKQSASEGRSRSAGAQEPEYKYMRVPSTAGTRDAERSRFIHKL